METKYLYLWLNILSFIVPFIASFYKPISFAKKWKYYLPGILITAVIFILWDEYFTRLGVWGFNEKYTTGIYIFTLPLEEVLFFFCIPYACTFTYFALSHLVKDFFKPHQKKISIIIIVLCMTGGLVFINKAYTAVTFISLSIFLLIDVFYLKASYVGRFFFAYLILLIPFFIVNGILTGSWIDEPVVWYNNNENLGFRIGTVPFEDIFYGMLMIIMSISIAEKLEVRHKMNNQ